MMAQRPLFSNAWKSSPHHVRGYHIDPMIINSSKEEMVVMIEFLSSVRWWQLGRQRR